MVARWQIALGAVIGSVMLIVSSVSCSSDSLEYARETVDDQGTLGVSRPGVPIRGVVVYFHGADRDETVLDFDEPHRELTAMLADAGYAVVASAAGGNSWGNAASQRNYVDLAYGAAEHYGATDIFFITESMGTVAAMNLMAENRVPVVGLAAINPLLNLDSLPPKYQAQAADANSGDALSSVDPIDFSTESMTGRNMRIYVTPDDQLVRTPENATAFERRFGRVANISVVWCEGEHMDASCIQGRDIVGWFNSLNPR